MKKLYYVVEKETEFVDTIEECTGWKKIAVYKIEKEELVFWFEVTKRNDESSTEAIADHLEENGFNPEDFTLIQI